MRLFDSAFSPFARKVRLVLDHKGLDYAALDSVRPEVKPELDALNARREIPVLQDGDVVVVNSADIVAYLEHRYPERPVYPADPALRVAARAWERRSDTMVDAITVDVSLWSWANRPDDPPPGLFEAARRDLGAIYDELEAALDGRDFLVGELSIADLALFPHLSAVGLLAGIPPAAPGLARAHARAADRRGRPAAAARLAAEAGRGGPGDGPHRLARRPHGVAAGPRLPRLVLWRDPGRPGDLAALRRSPQKSAWPGTRGKGMTSRMLAMPVANCTTRSKPTPKPAWGTEPWRRRSRYHQ